jgi:hypothetical protein
MIRLIERCSTPPRAFLPPHMHNSHLVITTLLAMLACNRVVETRSVAPPARPSSLPALDSARMLANLSRLAHDSMAGRGAMTPENAKARTWLSTEFGRIGLAPVGADFVQPFAMARPSSTDSIRGANVVGRVQGTRFGDRVIVVGAHFDHVGTRDGQIFNGADDNASGTAAVLELAAHFEAHPPAHTMVFALWDAEEVGHVGSRSFVAAAPVPLATIVANVNLDMVSRSDKGELYAAGAFHYPALRPVLDSLMPFASVTLRFGHDSGGGMNDWTTQSDHASFHAVKIPFMYFGVEDHADYHRPTDDVERIHPGFYVRAVRTIGGFVERLDYRLSSRP